MNTICHIHQYQEAKYTCERCGQPICADCAQQNDTTDGKKACPACALAYYQEMMPVWQADKTKKSIGLGITLALLLIGVVSSISEGNVLGVFFLGGLAGMSTVFTSGMAGKLWKSGGNDLVFKIIFIPVAFFILGAIIAPINAIRFAFNIRTAIANIKNAEARVPALQQLLSEADGKNKQAMAAARKEEEARTLAQQQQEQERQAQLRQIEEDRKKLQAERDARAAAASAPRPELYAVTLIDAGPYRHDVMEELKQLTGQQATEVQNGKNVASGLGREAADAMVAKLVALGAQAESRKS